MKLLKCMITVFSLALVSSCTKDLDRRPAYSTTAEVLYSTEAGYKSALAKIYGGLALTGNQGPAGNGDIRGIDEGFSDYLRTYFNLQELPTDEAVVSWNDQTIKDFHEMDWSASDNFVRALYSRLFYQITLANAFISESTDEKVNARGLAKDADKIKGYRSEARFLRALSYLHALDLFGNPTFVTDSNVVGTAFLPRQIKRAELFSYIEKEGKELESLLPEPKTNEYGRVDKGALWMLMANLYLNAQVYTGTAKNAEAIDYSGKVIGAGYTLVPKYANLFLADNDNSPEFIFAVAFDGKNTRSFGGTTFLTHAPVGGSMNAKDSFGVNGGWSGYRTTSALVNKFPSPTGRPDTRALFHTDGQNLEIADISVFNDGYGVKKWRNIKSNGGAPSDFDYSDVDFPIFRLAEAYLINAEAKLRVGSVPEAIASINKVVERAYGNTSNNYTTSLTLDNVLDERARELYWEGKRRTDLIRFGKFTTNAYLWPWKGGVANGTAVGSHRNLYPIPSPEINSNPNLQQNPGY